MTDRRAWAVLATLSLLALVAAGAVRIDRFWGDGATYHAMAWSFAYDQDIQYEARDLFRIRREFPSGPQGVFLKRASGGVTWDEGQLPSLRRVLPKEGRLYFAKPFLYSLCAAPFVRVFGTRGFYVLNALSFSAALLLGYAALRRQKAPGPSLALTLAIFLGTVTPLYLVWLAPEMFYVGLAMAALAAWRLDRPLLASILLGAATYAKPPHIFLSIPIVAAPLVTAGLPFARRLVETTKRGLVLTASTLLFFGLNVALTGEWNFQSGERKTFSDLFPFEVQDAGKHTARKITFGNSGVWMTTPTLGPQAEGDEAPPPTPRTEPPRPPSELRASFIRNLGYFWVGRFGGALPYFLPVVLAAVLFVARAARHRSGAIALAGVAAAYLLDVALIPEAWYGGGQAVSFVLLAAYMFPLLAAASAWAVAGPRDRDGALTLAALLATAVFYIWFIPDDWYGNGNLGNRYFVTLVPLALFFVPSGRERAVAVAAVLSAAVFLRPLFLAPIYHSTRPSADHAARAPYRFFPAELTMLNDLAVFVDGWRKKQAYGDIGDEHKHWPAEPTAYYLYFSDEGTYGREAFGGVDGFWLRGGARAEVLLRAFDLKPIRRIRIAVTGGPAGDVATIDAEGRREELTLAAGEMKEVVFAATPGFAYKETFLHVLVLRSRQGGADALGRQLGSFVRVTLEVDGATRGP